MGFGSQGGRGKIMPSSLADATRLAWAQRQTKTAAADSAEKDGRTQSRRQSELKWKGAFKGVSMLNFVKRASKEANEKQEYMRALVRRAKGKEEKRPASKASRMLRFSPSTIYFLILEKDWWFCGFLTSLVYGVPVVIVGLLSMLLELANDTEEAEYELHGYKPSKATLAFRFSASCVITMGYGTVVPTCNWGFAIGTISQVLGILINVFTFAAVLAKFQSPKADVVFSKQVCFFSRDSVRYLCIRIGNLRCHTLFNPSLRLFFLKHHETEEGESYIKIRELEVDEPGTVGGVYNLTHKIDGESPLADLKESDLTKKGEAMAFQCIFSALDPVYQADVCAKVSYTKEQLVFGKRFADMMQINSKTGRAIFDFAAFEELVDVPEYWDVESRTFEQTDFEMSNSEAPPKESTSKICLIIGYGRSSYANELLDGNLSLSVMRSECAFATAIALLLEEAGEAYDAYRVDLGDKPDWLKDVNPKMETPVCRLAGSEEWLNGTDHIFDRIRETCPSVSGFFDVSLPDSVNRTKECYQPHMLLFTLSLVHAKTDCPMRSFLFKKYGLSPELDAEASQPLLRQKCFELFDLWEMALGGKRANTIAQEQHRGDMYNSPRPPLSSQKICLVIGYGRSSYANELLDGNLPLSVMRAECAFSGSIAIMLLEAGEPYDAYRADLGDKPEWLKDVNPELQTPACRLAGSEEWLNGTDHIFDRIRETCPSVSGFFDVSLPDSVNSKKECYEPQGVLFALSLVHAKADCKMRNFLFSKFGVSPDLDAQASQPLLRQKMFEIFDRWELALGDQRPYLCGDKPGYLDFQLVCKLYFGYQLIESGLADLGKSFQEAAPLSFAYLKRFEKRKSFQKVFGPGYEVAHGKVHVPMVRVLCTKFTVMCPEINERVTIPSLKKARQAGMIPKEKGVGDMYNSPRPPLSSQKICLVIGYGRSSYANELLDGNLPLSVMRAECAFSGSIAIMLLEAGEPYDAYRADLGDKPEWLKDVNPELQTPACRLAGSEEWLNGTDHIFDRIRETCPSVSGFFDVSLPDSVNSKKECYEPQGVLFALSLVHAKADCKMRNFLFSKFGVSPDLDAQASQPLLRQKMFEIFDRWELALGDQRPYLCGDKPGYLDFQLVCKLYFGYQLIESGLADLGKSFQEAAPLSFAYLKRFEKRESFQKVFGPGYEVAHGKVHVPMVRVLCTKFTVMCPEINERVTIPSLKKARQAGMIPKEKGVGDMYNSPRPPLSSQKICLVIGYGRSSYANELLDGNLPLSVMRAECAFSGSIAIMLLEAGEPYDAYRADLGDKPEWLKDVNPELQTPACRLAGSEEWLNGTDHIFDRIRETCPSVSGFFDVSLPDSVNSKKECYEPQGVLFALSLVHAKADCKMRNFLFSKFGVSPDLDAQASQPLLRQKMFEIFDRWELALGDQRPYLCGDKPGYLDFQLVCKLYFGYQLIESGLADLGKSFQEAAPLSFAYLKRFEKRESFQKVFGPGYEVAHGKVHVPMVRVLCTKFTVMCPEINERVTIPSLKKARQAGMIPKEKGVGDMYNSPRPPLSSQKICLVIGYGRSSYANELLDGNLPLSVMRAECAFSGSIAIMLLEAGEPYDAYRADLGDKPEWLKDVNPELQTPACRLAGSEEWLNGTDHIFDRIRETCPSVSGFFDVSLPDSVNSKKECYEPQGVLFALSLVHAKADCKMRNFLFSKFGVSPDLDAQASQPLLRQKMFEIFDRWELALGDQRPYLCGDKPGYLDFQLVCKLYFGYQLIESGLADLGKSFPEAAPLSFAYLKRFEKRESFQKVFGPGYEVAHGKVHVPMVRVLCTKFTVMCPEINERVTIPSLKKARQAGMIPKEKGVGDMYNSPRPPLSSQKICLVIGYGRSSYANELLDGNLPLSVMRAECAFSGSIAIMLLEAGEPYDAYRADLGDKPEWLKDVNPELQTPACRLAGSEEWLNGTDHIFDRIRETCPSVSGFFDVSLPDSVNSKKECYEPQGVLFALSLVHAKADCKMRNFLFSKFGVSPDLDAQASQPLLRQKMFEIFDRWELALGDQRPYLCGDKPGYLDFQLVCKLYFGYQLIESGLADLGKSFQEAAPLSFAYLKRFEKRESFQKVFGPGYEVAHGKVHVPMVRVLCTKFTVMCPEINERVTIPSLKKARQAGMTEPLREAVQEKTEVPRNTTTGNMCSLQNSSKSFGKDRQYLCGDKPGYLDFQAATFLYLGFQLIESGLADLGKSFQEAAPLSFAYLKRFEKRKSWKNVFGPGYEVAQGKVHVPMIRIVCDKLVSMCPEINNTVTIPALERSRQAKLKPKKKPRPKLQRRDSSASATLCL